ncbi:MAG: MTAP family purine nucleoside phosphorylase [Deltaproteobacteria bacterium]|nr:MTAP family purine nucleoside phosphorylase [Deltaproteobacteria bacterium]
MTKIGIISGTTFNCEKVFEYLERKTVETEYGVALVYEGENAVFLSRHKNSLGEYVLPHEINHCANIAALQQLGVLEIIAVGSTGSLKEDIPPLAIMIPDDFVALYPLPTTIKRLPCHLTPEFNTVIRGKLLKAAISTGDTCLSRGTYLQTAGPRFETKAEIIMMRSFADVVGMTIASEGIIAQEMGVPYGAICSIDNYANGIGSEALSIDQVKKNATMNSTRIIGIIKQYLLIFTHSGKNNND